MREPFDETALMIIRAQNAAMGRLQPLLQQWEAAAGATLWDTMRDIAEKHPKVSRETLP